MRPQVLLLGTYHMANPNLDMAKTDHVDVLSEVRQREIQELVTRLTAFAPTKVAVEFEPSYQPTLTEQYQKYLQGDFTPGRNEVHQIGFRLAKAMGHKELHCIDYQLPMDFDALFGYLQAKSLTNTIAEVQQTTAEIEATFRRIEQDGGMFGLLRFDNSPASDALHGIYLRAAAIGAYDTYIGADVVGSWYLRNLKMYANIAALADSPDERIFVLVGAGHGKLLREFISESPLLDLADIQPYLV